MVLLQSGKSADLAAAFGGSGSQTAFGPRGSGECAIEGDDVVRGALHAYFDRAKRDGSALHGQCGIGTERDEGSARTEDSASATG